MQARVFQHRFIARQFARQIEFGADAPGERIEPHQVSDRALSRAPPTIATGDMQALMADHQIKRFC